MKELEMPVPCNGCSRLVDLNDTRESTLDKGKMLCPECYHNDSEVKFKIEEIEDIQYMLDNNEKELRCDRKGWKRNIKELKKEIIELGYDPEEYL